MAHFNGSWTENSIPCKPPPAGFWGRERYRILQEWEWKIHPTQTSSSDHCLNIKQTSRSSNMYQSHINHCSENWVHTQLIHSVWQQLDSQTVFRPGELSIYPINSQNAIHLAEPFSHIGCVFRERLLWEKPDAVSSGSVRQPFHRPWQ